LGRVRERDDGDADGDGNDDDDNDDDDDDYEVESSYLDEGSLCSSLRTLTTNTPKEYRRMNILMAVNAYAT
jgi:hypothetical protein